MKLVVNAEYPLALGAGGLATGFTIVASKVIGWVEATTDRPFYETSFNDIERFRAALIDSPAVTMQHVTDPLAILFAVTKGGTPSDLAQPLVEMLDSVVDQLGFATLAQFAANGVAVAGTMLTAMTVGQRIATEDRLSTRIDVPAIAVEVIERIGVLKLDDESSCQEFIAWVSTLCNRSGRVRLGIEAEQSIIAKAAQHVQDKANEPMPDIPGLVQFSDEQALDLLNKSGGRHHA